MPKLVLFSGPAGTGKTTISKKTIRTYTSYLLR